MSVPNFCKNCNARLDGGPGYCELPMCRVACRMAVTGGKPEEATHGPAMTKIVSRGGRRLEPYFRTKETPALQDRRMVLAFPGLHLVPPGGVHCAKLVAQGWFQPERLIVTGKVENLVIETMYVGCDTALSEVALRLFYFGDVEHPEWMTPEDRFQLAYPLMSPGIECSLTVRNEGETTGAPATFRLAFLGNYVIRNAPFIEGDGPIHGP